MTAESISSAAAQARAFQLVSQALPTGAFAYSGGLEAALETGLLTGEADAQPFMISWQDANLVYLELPYFLRMIRAVVQKNDDGVADFSARLFASRESAELQAQDRQMARALHRILKGICPDACPPGWSPLTYSEALARSVMYYGLREDDALMVCAYGWIEQHISALCRLIPLGPLAGQKLLDACLVHLPGILERAHAIESDDIGVSCPRLALASGHHETQYTRLFRS